MASWTTTTKVERYLPTGYAALITTSMANLIVEASAIAYADLSPRYWAFPDAADTPATPDVVQNAVAYLAAHLAQLELGRANEIAPGADDRQQNLMDLYRDRVNRLMSDDTEKRALVPLTLISCEAMTFGTDPMGDNQYRLNPGGLGDLDGFEVIPESARIDDFETGVDFAVVYYPSFRAWILDRYTSAITDAMCVTYSVDWLKRRELTKPESRYGVELIRG